ncbi:MAG: MMPL family transporter, partial [Flavobacteriaceae bacterium]|nr:MMPL family transporter [Flavobacteriaceae bacterium]
MGRMLLKYRFYFLGLILLTAILSCFKISSIQINTDFSQFLPDNDPEFSFYKDVQSQMKGSESLIVLGVTNTPSIYSEQFLNNVHVFVDSLKDINGIKSVRGLTNLSRPTRSLFGTVQIPYFPGSDSLNMEVFRNRIRQDFQITQNFINNDETSLFIWLELEEPHNSPLVQSALVSIEEVKNQFSDLDIFIWGKPYLQKELNEITKTSTNNILLYVLFFLVLALSFIYKSLRAVILSIGLVLVSLIIFIGLLVYLGRPFNLMSTLFPTIILVVGVSDLIHLSIKYNLEIARGSQVKVAIIKSIKEIGLAIFITSFTTALGFFILQLSPMQVLRNFGMEAGIAVILTFLITLVLVPTFFRSKHSRQSFVLSKRFESYSEK